MLSNKIPGGGGGGGGPPGPPGPGGGGGGPPGPASPPPVLVPLPVGSQLPAGMHPATGVALLLVGQIGVPTH